MSSEPVPGIIVEFCGGLGNKMFQLSAGYMASRKYNCPLYYVNSANSNHHGNTVCYTDNIFKYMGNALTPDEINAYKCAFFPSSQNRIFNHTQQFWISTEKYEMPDNLSIPVIFDQYFQYYPPLKSVEYELRDIYIKGLAEPISRISMEFSSELLNNSVFIHIRRGDYLQFPRHPIIPITYYEKCMSEFTTHTHFFVFSDDVEWIKTQPQFSNNSSVTIIDSNDEIYSLAFMSLCKKGAICANSSFSWWGAFLGAHGARSSVYVPMPWMFQCTIGGLFPEEWNTVQWTV